MIGLLVFGFMALEKMFPKLREECQKANIRYFILSYG
jgi:hypothetical protein